MSSKNNKSKVLSRIKTVLSVYETKETLPDDILHLEDRNIGGWIEKRSKNNGYFSSLWKRYYVVVENLKFNYYLDSDLAV